MIKFEWGSKRTCQSCAERFYDLRKSPSVCPKCGTVQEVIAQTRSRRGKADKLRDALVIDDPLLVGDLDLDGELGVGVDADAGLIEDDVDLDGDLDVLQVDDESIDDR